MTMPTAQQNQEIFQYAAGNPEEAQGSFPMMPLWCEELMGGIWF